MLTRGYAFKPYGIKAALPLKRERSPTAWTHPWPISISRIPALKTLLFYIRNRRNLKLLRRRYAKLLFWPCQVKKDMVPINCLSARRCSFPFQFYSFFSGIAGRRVGTWHMKIDVNIFSRRLFRDHSMAIQWLSRDLWYRRECTHIHGF